MRPFKKVDNVQTVLKIEAAIEKAGGQCPCVPEKMRNADTICKCKDFREGRGCHCGLYVYLIVG